MRATDKAGSASGTTNFIEILISTPDHSRVVMEAAMNSVSITPSRRTLRPQAQAAALPADLGGLEGIIHSLLLSALEKMVDRMDGASLRSDDQSRRPLAIAETDAIIESPVRSPVEPPEAMLRVGSLQLDLINRTAKRGGRPIDLLPREFRLLKYMMQRHGQLLTRANLFQDVWHYKFLPESNLVDVHMGRLRRKVDGPNEAPMIRTVRGAGFILSATSEKPSSTKEWL
jgi:DNA-binding winged helix-turn-helix (wHTH) protein